jgi:membrane protein
MNAGFLRKLIKATGQSWVADRCFRMAGALAYYSVFSMAPLLLIAIGVASQVFGEEASREQILEQVKTNVGQSAREAVAKLLEHAAADGGGVLATAIGAALLLFGASGVFAELQDDLIPCGRFKQGKASACGPWPRTASCRSQ